MEHKVVAPAVGESITEVRILRWAKENGQAVKAGEVLLEIESDKATVEVAAESAGALRIQRQEGEMVKIGEVLGVVDDSAKGSTTAAKGGSVAAKSGATDAHRTSSPESSKGGATESGRVGSASTAPNFLSPAVRKIATEKNLDPSQVSGSGKDGRVTKGDLLAQSNGSVRNAATSPSPAPASSPAKSQLPPDREGDRRVPMTRLRARIAERLVQAQHTAAILTTFNEVDMGPVMDVRSKHKEAFKAKHGVALSFMSFFTRACTLALKDNPAVNASTDGQDIVYHDYMDIGIAVGTDRGLVVPVLRNAQKLTFVDIEKGIGELATKARDGKLSIPDMTGGTFTISNGGVYGSLMSTPILNPPQSGILGMHKIQERPMAVDGKVVVRPMMYLALSYDHRLIDGKEAVTFLVKVKELLEKPESLGMEFING